MSNFFYETMDNYFFPTEIGIILDAAILICPAMKRQNKKLFPANANRLLPEICFGDDERCFMVAEFLNKLVELC